jgi:biopolymer transport protein ExbB/TolQ
MKKSNLTFLQTVGIIAIIALIFLSLAVFFVFKKQGETMSENQKTQENIKAEAHELATDQNEFQQTSTKQFYVVREYEGYLAIYIQSNQSDELDLLKVTEISIKEIDQSLQNGLLETIQFASIEALENYLEGILT